MGVPMTDEEISYCTALPFLAAAVFAMVWGYIANVLGRKITAYLCALCYVVGYTIILNTNSIQLLIISRMIGGLAYIPTLFNGPMYVAETAEPKNLGRLSSTLLIAENIGVLMVYIIGGHVSFRFLNLFCALFGCIFFLLIIVFPESPVFYLKNDRFLEAKLSLQFYRPRGNDVLLTEELNRLSETFVLSKKLKLKYLFTRHTSMALFIALCLQIGIQFSGINYMTTYTLDLFQRSHTLVDPYVCLVIAGTFYTIGPFIYFYITNHFGRKPITIVSYFLLSVVLASLGWYYFLIEHDMVDGSSPVNYMPVVCMSLYFLTYAAGAACTPFTIYGEIFSSEVRNAVMPFIYIWNASLSALVIKLASTVLLETIQTSGVMWVFAASCAILTVYTIVFVPETKDKPFLTLIEELTKKACW